MTIPELTQEAALRALPTAMIIAANSASQGVQAAFAVELAWRIGDLFAAELLKRNDATSPE